LDPYVVFSPTRGATGGDGFWVQPYGNGSSGFIQPVRLVIAQLNYQLMYHRNCFIFRWLVHVATLCDPWIINFWDCDLDLINE
jgi:hypothetical protein